MIAYHNPPPTMIEAPAAHKKTVNQETKKKSATNNEYHVVHNVSKSVIPSRMKIRRTLMATATIASGP